MRRPWRELNHEERVRAARTDPRQSSLFGTAHSKEIQRKLETSQARRAFYAQVADEIRARRGEE